MLYSIVQFFYMVNCLTYSEEIIVIFRDYTNQFITYYVSTLFRTSIVYSKQALLIWSIFIYFFVIADFICS